MPQIASITVLDGKTTPESHVFNPKSTTPVAIYRRDGVAGQPAVAWEGVAVKVKLGNNGQQNIVDLDLTIPVLEQIASGAANGYVAPPKVAYIARAKVSFYTDPRADIAVRKDLRVILQNLLANAQVIGAVENLEQAF